MIAYIGSADTVYTVQLYASKHNIQLAVIDTDCRIERLTDEIITRQYTHIIIDVSYLISPAAEICEAVRKISTCCNASLIFRAVGYTPEANVIASLIEMGMYNFIFGASLSEQKDELEKCMTGAYRGRTDLTEYTAGREPDAEPETGSLPVNIRPYITVGVAGCMPRMGTTTQALQVVKYLQFTGKHPCLIQLNQSGYAEKLAKYYECAHDVDIGMVSVEHTELYYRREKISEIYRLGYDAYVYDYGVFAGQTSFFERDVKIIVCGSKPDEMEAFSHVIGNTYMIDDIYYIFSFTPDKDRQEILAAMEDRAGKTFFAPYTPDMFSYVKNPAHDNIFGVYGDISESGRTGKRLKKFRRKRSDMK